MSEEAKSGGRIGTVPELLAHALAMESEAADRYGELAEQMETHRKAGVAAIFRRLETAEREHVGDLQDMCKRVTLPEYAPWDYKWESGESPETIALDKVHYQMSVKAAVELALEHERKAVAFYLDIAEYAAAADVKKLARQFADEEKEHVSWLEECLVQCASEERVVDDPDPPLSQE